MRALMFGFVDKISISYFAVALSKNRFLEDSEHFDRDSFARVFATTMQAFQLTFGLLFRRVAIIVCLILPAKLCDGCLSKIEGKSAYSRKNPRALSPFAATLSFSDCVKSMMTCSNRQT